MYSPVPLGRRSTLLDDGHHRELEALAPPYPLGSGYAFCWSPIPAPVRRLPAETKARLRRTHLRKRLERDAPLFAAPFYAAELRRRAPYFAGEDVTPAPRTGG